MEMITHGEREKLEQRLAQLRANRPVISERIRVARELGDLKENGDYHAAKDAQGLEEAEIRRLEARLASAHVVEEGTRGGGEVVFLGSTVTLKDVDSGRQERVKMVGELSGDESDEVDEVTVSSPMGEALMKARVGEVVKVNAPRGVKRYEVVEIA